MYTCRQEVYQNGSIDSSFHPPLFSLDSTFKFLFFAERLRGWGARSKGGVSEVGGHQIQNFLLCMW
jgi:hypothetical protein